MRKTSLSWTIPGSCDNLCEKFKVFFWLLKGGEGFSDICAIFAIYCVVWMQIEDFFESVRGERGRCGPLVGQSLFFLVILWALVSGV